MVTKTNVAVEFPGAGAATPRMGGKVDQVRSVFENAPRYLNGRQVDMRVRSETVRAFAAGLNARRILDIGCGDGSISLPLLTRTSQLTLLDLSASMAALAKANVPEDLAGNVEVRNEDFMAASFEPRSFDLIVSVGVLAHVDSADNFLAKIAGLLRPGGSLIVEFTDSRHAVGRLERFAGWLKEIVAPAKYSTNRLSFRAVSKLFDRHGMKLETVFRYARIPIPGIEKVVTHDFSYNLVELIFGRCPNNKNAWLGNEYICLLTAS
jgi:SAM-dependent methyltransferase